MASERIAMCQRSESILDEYISAFSRRWAMSKQEVIDIGCAGKTLFAAEFKERGPHAYIDSVVLPIRNACYMAAKMESRWAGFAKFTLNQPLLDYGCGVGFQLMWLNRIGYTKLYGHELLGVQRDVMLEVCKPHGIRPWAEGETVDTVLCMNVLEHLDDPVAELMKMKAVSKQVIANVCLDEDDESHIAPMEARLECARLLKEWGTFYGS